MAVCKCKCPNCGKIIEIDDKEFMVNCRFCGVPFLPREGKAAYQEYLLNNVSVDTVSYEGDMSNLKVLGLQALKENNPEKCGFYSEDILKRDALSAEGLLLKGFFAADNYSVEEGIRCYLAAYENAKTADLKKLIIDTFIKGFEKYKAENFAYLFSVMKKNLPHELKEVYLTALTHLSTSLLTDPEMLKKLELPQSTIDGLVEDYQTRIIDNNTFLFSKEFIAVSENGKLTHFLYSKLIKKTVECFHNKKDNTYRYVFYYPLDEERVDEIVLSNNSLSDILKSEGYEIKEIASGCYVATCVYHGYSKNEVNVLRRYRDECLNKHFLGRIFIRCYYTISPSLIMYLEKYPRINNAVKKILDKFVISLKKKGYEGKIYHE